MGREVPLTIVSEIPGDGQITGTGLGIGLGYGIGRGVGLGIGAGAGIDVEYVEPFHLAGGS